MTFSMMLRRPSAFLPPAMSLVALGIVIGYVALFGTEPQPDEGAAAHLWQFLMAAQAPIIAYFSIRSLPEAPRQAAAILAFQIALALAALAPVYLLGF